MALKVCRVHAKDETLTADPQDLFTMETGIGEALRHPNIVQLFGSEVVPVMKQQADGETEQLDEEGGSSVMPSFFDVSTFHTTIYMAGQSTSLVLYAPLCTSLSAVVHLLLNSLPPCFNQFHRACLMSQANKQPRIRRTRRLREGQKLSCGRHASYRSSACMEISGRL